MTENKRKAHKQFLNQEQKESIIKDSKILTEDQLAENYKITVRHVHDILAQNEKPNIFTEEEDKKIISLYQSGIIKESQIAKILTNKKPWMIRNRIRYLKNHDFLDSIKYNTSTEHQTEQEDIHFEVSTEHQTQTSFFPAYFSKITDDFDKITTQQENKSITKY